MRRLAVLTMVLGLAGCAALRDAFSAHAEVVGTALGGTRIRMCWNRRTVPARYAESASAAVTGPRAARSRWW